MDSIIDCLVKAGYFRARIAGLSDFDRIIGGMAWAVQFFTSDVSIDIFYTDSLDLGQKIALTERLVMVLLVMNCPHYIEPHQIVGLDYGNLLPAIKWLIQRSAEVRREQESFNRLLALRYFHRVTRSAPKRTDWCHLVKLDSPLVRADNQVDENELSDTAKLDLNTASASLAREVQLENCHVSFLNLPSLLRIRKVGSGQSKKFTQPARQPEMNDLSSSSDEEAETNIQIPLSNEVSCAAQSKNGEEIDNDLQSNTGSEPHDKTAEFPILDDATIALHKELDTELLATNQKIVNLVKKVDCMPGKLEMIQYQRRYIELHQQLISKNRDLKKLYALFNSLDSCKHYLNKELNLLDSIQYNLGLVGDSEAQREDFTRQLVDIIIKIGGVRDDVSHRLNGLRERCEALKCEYSSYLEYSEGICPFGLVIVLLISISYSLFDRKSSLIESH